jgi:AraC-like DNA-binding protein
MDALSEALRSVHITGAIFADTVCTAPWGFSVPAMDRMAHLLAAGSERLVGYHLVTEGRALIALEGIADVTVVSGDIIVIPHGEAHTIRNGSPATLIDGAHERWLNGDLSTMWVGGGGETTRVVCGYFGCERHAAGLFLAGLPSILKLNIRRDAGGRWLESSIRHLLGEAASDRPGRGVLLSKMAEALFIETLRRYVEELPTDGRGWLAAARDPVVGRALALLHRQPGDPWTLASLACDVGASRSLLARRFGQLLGESPLAYLARWRLQVAARLLATTQKAMIQVAMEVGYESESAFNRAFKREFGLPPAKYRRALADEQQPVLHVAATPITAPDAPCPAPPTTR